MSIISLNKYNNFSNIKKFSSLTTNSFKKSIKKVPSASFNKTLKGSKPSFAYYEKSKYFSYWSPSKVDHSFLWQRWVKLLVNRKNYYLSLQQDLSKHLSVNYPELSINTVQKFRMPVRSFSYQLDNIPTRSFVRRKRVNFFTYRNFRFNQLRLFYTTCNKKQFMNLYKNYSSIKKKVLDHFLLSLEGRLEFFLYRTNFFPSKYFIRQFISHHGVLINGYLVNNKNYILKPWDVISIPKSQYARILDLLKIKFENIHLVDKSLINNFSKKKAIFKKFSVLNISPLFNINFFYNYPRYMEVDYVLLEAMFIRLPNINEVIFPENSEIDPNNRSFNKW